LSITIPVPGGEAELLTTDEMTPRRQRATQVIALQASPLMKKLNQAKTLTLPDGTTKANPAAGVDSLPDVELSESEANLFFKITDASIYAHLKSWTLTNPDGTPLARPDSIDAVQDIPSPVYDALSAAINAMPQVAEQFEASDRTVPDQSSPFGGSASSPTDSPQAAPSN
jgi:hypothetical protein